MQTVRALLAADGDDDTLLTQGALRAVDLPVEVIRVGTVAQFRNALTTANWDVVLCVHGLRGLDVARVLDLVRTHAGHLPVVVVTGAMGEEAVADLMRLGVADVVLTGRLVPRLATIVRREAAFAGERVASARQLARGEAVLEALAPVTSWHEALDVLLRRLARDFGGVASVMWEVMELHNRLQAVATWSTPRLADLVATLSTMPLLARETVLGQSVLRDEAVVVSEIAVRVRSPEATPVMVEAAKHVLCSYVCCPFKADGRRFGIAIMFEDPAIDLNTALVDLHGVALSLQPVLFRKLIEYERRLLLDALDAAHSGVIITEAEPLDPPGPRIVYTNRAVSLMSGYEPAELIGSTPRLLQGPDTNRDKLDVVRRALVAAEPVSVDLLNYRRDGTPFLVTMDITPVREQDRVTRFLAIQTDITARHHAEQARLAQDQMFRALERRAEQELLAAKDRAEQAEALLRDAIDSISEGFVMYDRDERFVMCNEAFLEFYSRSADILVPGATFEDIIRGNASRGEYAEAIGRGEEWIGERLRHFRARAGTVEQPLSNGRWVQLTDRPMRNGGMAGLRVDITALKRAEAALRESEEKLERAQEIAGMGSWELDLSTGAFTWSKEMFRLRGVAPGSFTPTAETVGSDIHAEDRSVYSAWLSELSAGTVPAPLEVRFHRADGEIRLAALDGRPLIDADGVLRRVSGTLRDITQRRLMERQLAQSQRLEAIGSLTAGMSHDFNNMLAVVIVNVELALRQLKHDAAASELCAEALDGAKRCADLIQRLLAFARRQPLHPQQTGVNTLIQEISRLLRRTLGEHIQLRLELAPSLWPVMVDPAQLDAALVNLATNARDAMPQGGRLDIATHNVTLDQGYVARQPDVPEGDYVLIEVADTGEGIPSDIITRIFDPFFTTKEAGTGTGLGLSMTFGFAKQSGGHLAVYSEVGLGTTLRLYLPRSHADTTSRTASLQPAEVCGGHETILVVEDNALLRRATVRQLRALGYQVREAGDPDTALSIIANDDAVDLLFSDVVMPGTMDGLDLVIEARRRRPALAALLTSGFPKMRGSPDRLAESSFHFLKKPYELADLARALREVLMEVGG